MKIFKTILLVIFDPISTFVSRSFPDFSFKLCNKHIFIQVLLALLLTVLIILLGR